MDNGLINRTNIVRSFIKSFNNMVVDPTRSDVEQTVLISPDGELYVECVNGTHEFKFYMNMQFSVLEEDYNTYANPHLRNSNSISNKIPINYTEHVQVMRLMSNGEFTMISADSDSEWVRNTYVAKRDANGDISHFKGMQTILNIGYKVLPDSEESHFQRMTTDGLILELDECIAISKMVQRFKEYGSLIQVTPDIKAYMYF